MRATNLPAAPLRALVADWLRRDEHRSADELAARAGVSRRCLERLMGRESMGIHFISADRIVTAMGSHPALVWPKDWARVHEEGAA